VLDVLQIIFVVLHVLHCTISSFNIGLDFVKMHFSCSTLIKKFVCVTCFQNTFLLWHQLVFPFSPLDVLAFFMFFLANALFVTLCVCVCVCVCLCGNFLITSCEKIHLKLNFYEFLK
jgi:hypothetical protein